MAASRSCPSACAMSFRKTGIRAGWNAFNSGLRSTLLNKGDGPMPATFTRTPVDVERRNPGIGGKPPVDQRPTGGGGDGDNWENRPGGRGPRTLLRRYRMTVALLLAGDLIVFMVLASALFVHQGSGHIDARNQFVSDWHPVPAPSILWLNTIVLLLSSLTMEMGRRQLFREVDV